MMDVSASFLDVLSLCAKIADHSRDADFIDRAQSVGRQAQGDEAVLFSEPKAFFLQVGLKAASFDPGDFQADPFFLLGNPADGVRFAADRHFAGHLTFL